MFSCSVLSNDDEFTSFAQALRSVSSDELDHLDPENGPAVLWRSVCQSKLDNPMSLTPDERDYWSLERNTWQLVQMLYTQRTAGPQPTDQNILSNPYLPPLNVVNIHLAKSKDLLELSTVRDWLHTCPTQTHPAEIRRGYWPYSKSSIKHIIQRQNPSKNFGSKKNTYPITSLDPDAPLRPIEPRENSSSEPNTLGSVPQTADYTDQKGQLDQLDQDYDRAMVRTLYEYVRAGEIGLALDFCRQCDHPWRAASLSGGRLFYDRALAYPGPGSNLISNEDQMDLIQSLDGGNEIDSQAGRSGCLNRKLWKSMCFEMSTNKSLPTYEQALYGALAGEVSPVLPVCSSWEDHIWCHINSIFEKEVDRIIESSQMGYYWSHGCLPSEIDESQKGKESSEANNFMDVNQPQPDIKLAMNSAFDKVLRSENQPLAESARNPFHVAQMWLAIDKTNDLLETFASRLQSTGEDLPREKLSHLLRFFSHLTLFLRAIGERINSDVANAIIRAYVHVLELENKHDLIAFYVSELQEESGVETYARYLISLGPEADRQTRRVALLRALEHGLDLSRVACTAVQLTLQDVVKEPMKYQDDGALQRLDHQLNDKQRHLIRSLEWLTIDPVTYQYALTQGNLLTRYFLASGHPNAARQVVRSFPPDLLSIVAKEKRPDEILNADGLIGATPHEVLEFTQYRDFFNCLELHVQVNEVLSQRPLDGAPINKVQAFIQPLGHLCDRLFESIVEILTSEWLQGIKSNPPLGNPTTNERDPEQDRKIIRKMYVPELVFRLHGALVDSGHFIPNNMRKALELSTIVADESFQNYLEFLPDQPRRSNNNNAQSLAISTKLNNSSGNGQSHHKMKDYLREIRALVLMILARSGSNPLKPVINNT
ncbi:107-domain-containing protein [Phakopsora pachyrhizi]|uniref:Nuclear pore complex protein n=1 Tax=Phakopsora pachyrhizi TaxID=170000 RepID=A0AAV0AWH6_PHAPC|nr:107-domain-containing protein [Phakopsora pachyrhizi]CAH7674552.1 107-domain-containing protein [Phakopsora pachyrhizi]